MTIDECKKAFAKSRLFSRPMNTEKFRIEASEAQLQKYANDAITLHGWSYLRFPDGFIKWMYLSAPNWIKAIFFSQIGSKMPDNLMLIPLGGGTFFGVKLELKTRSGAPRGKQRDYAQSEGWYIARSPEQINVVLDEIEKKVQKIKESC
jgi:hypothetical protein